MLRQLHANQPIVTAAIVLAAVAAGCSEPQRTISPSDEATPPLAARYTLGSGFGGPLLGRATIPDGFKLKRKNGPWEIDINAKDTTDVAVQSLTIQPGGQSGWHSHPGPVVLQVTAGTITFYEAGDRSCTPIVKNVGQVFIEEGDHAHIGRNEGTVAATAIAIVFSPRAHRSG